MGHCDIESIVVPSGKVSCRFCLKKTQDFTNAHTYGDSARNRLAAEQYEVMADVMAERERCGVTSRTTKRKLQKVYLSMF